MGERFFIAVHKKTRRIYHRLLTKTEANALVEKIQIEIREVIPVSTSSEVVKIEKKVIV